MLSRSLLACVGMMLLGCNGQGMNMKCLEFHCHESFKACMDDKTCMELMSCSGYCMETWDSDPTPQKIHAQNCTLKCSASFENDISNTFMACALNNNCVTFPPINETCPAQLPKHIEANSSIGDLAGEWWQHYGHNPLWDCYPCQHIHSMKQVNQSTWAYVYSYNIYLVNNSLEYFQQLWYLPNPEQGITINITYDYMGTMHQESWYLLQSTERYVILVDCSYMYTWTNVGSIVWVRPGVVLNDDEKAAIAKVYDESLGWKFPDDFCETAHESECPEGLMSID